MWFANFATLKLHSLIKVLNTIWQVVFTFTFSLNNFSCVHHVATKIYLPIYFLWCVMHFLAAYVLVIGSCNN